MSYRSEKLVHPKDLVPQDDQPIAIVIGAMAHGQVLFLLNLLNAVKKF